MGIYSSASNITTTKAVSDKVGYIRALLNDIDNEGTGLEYDSWISLVPILKYELNDEDLAFDIFDEFSSQNEFYDEDFTYTKFYDAGLEADGRLTMGSLVYMVKENLGDSYDKSKYAQYFGDVETSKVAEFNNKIRRNKNKLPDHYLPDEIEDIKFPENTKVDHVLALTTLLVEGETYGTCCDPRQCAVIDPFAGDRMEQYITVNPIKGSRKQDNVVSFKYAVLEFDTIDLNEQFSLLNVVDLPYEALIFTGNKSIHAWIRIDAPDNDEYKKRTRLIAKMFSDFGYNKENGNAPDTAVLFDSSSLVRCPGTVRVDWASKGNTGAGNMQYAMWVEESTGWDEWYTKVYPKYVLESSLVEEIPDELNEFTVPDKPNQFSRMRKNIVEQFGEEFATPLAEGLAETPSEGIKEALLEAIPEFFGEWVKRNKRKNPLSVDELYHLFIDSCREGGAHYEGDIQEALYNGCVNAQRYIADQFKERKERAQGNVESLKEVDFDGSDPDLLEAIDKEIYKAANSEKPEDYEKLEVSLDQVAADMQYRPGVLKKLEIFKYASKLGKLLNGETKDIPHLAFGSLYAYRKQVSYFDPTESTLIPVEVSSFPSIIQPYIAIVKQDAKGLFKVEPLDNDSCNKLIKSHLFLKELREVEIMSEVPVFKELDNGAELIMEYDDEKACLITKPVQGYGFMDLNDAKELILSLFTDFEFVNESDLSRSIAALFAPAMCFADFFEGNHRPVWYVDADAQGAGKNTLVDFITVPYADSPAKITQDDSSIGSLDDKLGSAVAAGDNLIIMDNMKPDRKMKELSSSFIESMLTSDTMRHREAMKASTTLKTDKVSLYVTTNGMAMSKDMAERSMYISIRKKPYGYKFKSYPRGHVNWIKDNRPMIMSAIYTIMKEYLDHGKPSKDLEEGHRFPQTTSILNYIVTEIFGLPDISLGLRKRMLSKSDVNSDILRTICFVVEKTGNLGNDLNNIDIFELLDSEGQSDVLRLDSGIEIYTDEENTKISADAKRAVGQKLSSVMSRPNIFGKPNSKREPSTCMIEEFTVERSYCPSNRTPRYKVTK